MNAVVNKVKKRDMALIILRHMALPVALCPKYQSRSRQNMETAMKNLIEEMDKTEAKKLGVLKQLKSTARSKCDPWTWLTEQQK